MSATDERPVELPGDRSAAVALLVYPEEWVRLRRKEWGPLTAAASQAGFDAVVAHWGQLSVADGRVVARRCTVRSGARAEPIHGVTATFLPDVVLTTWGVDWDHAPLFERILEASGCHHTESPVLAWLDGKTELEVCLRSYEEQSNARVTRPLTLTSEEAADGVGPLGHGPVIVKPSRGGQCRGIEIVASGEIADMARDAAEGRRAPFVVQALVDDVFLYEGRRWDARVHAMATSLDPLVVHVYREGVAKTTGAVATPGGAALEEWLNAESYLDGVRPAENLSLSRMLDGLQRSGAPLAGFWERMEELVRHVFRAVALVAESWPPQPERAVLFAGFDVIIERRRTDDFALRLLEINSHPGLGWDPPVADELAPSYREWFGDLLALDRGQRGAPRARRRRA